MHLIAWWSKFHSAALVALLVPWVKWYLMVSFVGIYCTLVKCISNTVLDQILQKNWAVYILLKDWIDKWFFTASCLSMRYFAVPFHVFVRIWHKSVWRRVSSPWGKVSLLIFLGQEWEEILKLICGSLNPRQWRGNQGCGTWRGSDAMASEPKLRSVFKLLSLGVFLCSALYLCMGRCALCSLVSDLSVA